MAKNTKKGVRQASSRSPNADTLVEVEKSQEHWNQYDLADGSIIRIKPVVTDVFHVKGEYAPDGNPVYKVSTTLIVNVRAPETLKKK